MKQYKVIEREESPFSEIAIENKVLFEVCTKSELLIWARQYSNKDILPVVKRITKLLAKGESAVLHANDGKLFIIRLE